MDWLRDVKAFGDGQILAPAAQSPPAEGGSHSDPAAPHIAPQGDPVSHWRMTRRGESPVQKL